MSTHNQSSKDEARTKLHQIMIAFRREEGNGWIDRCIEHLDEAMLLLNSEKQKSVLEGRIDELEKLPKDIHSIHATRRRLCIPTRYVNARVTELNQSKDQTTGNVKESEK